MYRKRLMVVLAAQFATAAALFPTHAGAEPKNESPFTRSADVRILQQAVHQNVFATVPAGEAKNELPFTRPSSSGAASQAVQTLDPAIATAMAAQAAQQSSANVTRPSSSRVASQTVQYLDPAIATAMAARAGSARGATSALEARSVALNRRFQLGQYALSAAPQSSGFVWKDAGIGAGAMLGLALLAAGCALSLRHGRSQTRISATAG